ncbi:hypothetical protein QTP88_020010 [Uroleucon formosanum]
MADGCEYRKDGAFFLINPDPKTKLSASFNTLVFFARQCVFWSSIDWTINNRVDIARECTNDRSVMQHMSPDHRKLAVSIIYSGCALSSVAASASVAAAGIHAALPLFPNSTDVLFSVQVPDARHHHSREPRIPVFPLFKIQLSSSLMCVVNMDMMG